MDTDAEQLHLDAVRKAKFVLQIAADDEYRENFCLTNINSAGVRGLEFTLPGVHSDIGGCYVDGAEEKSYIYSGTEEECKEFKKILEEEGWFIKEQLEIFKIKSKLLGVKYNTYYELRGTRKLSNHYDKIPLQMMFHYSTFFDVVYNDKKIEENKISNNDVSAAYTHICEYIDKCHKIHGPYWDDLFKDRKLSAHQYQSEIKNISYLSDIDKELLKRLRNKFLHWSVNIGEDATGMGPHVDNVVGSLQRKRYIIQG